MAEGERPDDLLATNAGMMNPADADVEDADVDDLDVEDLDLEGSAPAQAKPATTGSGGGWRERVRNSPMGNIAAVGITALLVIGGLWVVNNVSSDDDASALDSATSGTSAVELTGATKGDAPAVGKRAPGFEGVTTDGQAISTEALKGKPAWLVFGATWCANCRSESPDIQAVEKSYGDRVTIVGVYVGESQATVADYAKRLGLTFPQIADAETVIGSAYRVMGVPMNVFVNASGEIESITPGAVSEADAKAELDKLLREAPAAPSTPAPATAGAAAK